MTDTSPHFRLGERPALDGLRALAVAFVVLLHYTAQDSSVREWFSGGFIGVEVFFVLSGFLITSLVLAEFENTGTWLARPFYRRRAFRLIPALYVMVAACVTISVLFTVPRFGDAADQPWAAVSSLTYVFNLITRLLDFVPFWAAPLWSLCVEVHFYLVWPLLLVAAARRGPQYLPWVAGGVLAASLLARVLTFATVGQPFATIFTTSRLDGLAAGGLVAICLHRGWRPPGRLDLLAPGALLGLATVVVLGKTDSWWMIAAGYTFVDLCTIVLLLHALDAASSTGRVLSLAPMRRVGQWSYSIYLWHVPVLAIVATQVDRHRLGMLISLLGTLAIAAASATFVETPLRKLGRKRPKRVLASDPV